MERPILVLKGETTLMVPPFVLPGLAVAFLVRMTTVWFMFGYVMLEPSDDMLCVVVSSFPRICYPIGHKV